MIDNTMIISHRGATALPYEEFNSNSSFLSKIKTDKRLMYFKAIPEKYSENSLAAFHRAVDLGFDGIEMDVRLTRDNEFIVMHDSDISRTTDGSGKVSDLTYKEIKRYKLQNGETVPRLLDLIEELQGKVIFFIELADRRLLQRDEEKLISLLEKKAILDEVVLLSFFPVSLRKFKSLYPQIKTVQLIRNDRIYYPFIKMTMFLAETEFIAPAVFMVNDKYITDIQRKKTKYGIIPWCANTKEEFSRVLSYNPAGIITDTIINNKE